MGQGPAVSRQPVVLSDLTEDQLVRARLRAEHVPEAETGYRSGSPHRALPHEPRPGFDPETTLLTDRRRAKAREIKEMPPAEAKRLGLEHLSFRTLGRLGGRDPGEDVVPACADGRWTRRGGGHPTVTAEVRDHAIGRAASPVSE
ncbi:hypothetical protein ACPC54_41110 [Kitasatospora sp. NPDC094028]